MMMTNFTFAFGKGIEEKIKNYVAKNPKKEVFISLFGNVRGRGRGKTSRIEYMIQQVAAFPNYADRPMYFGEIPQNWLDVCGEICKLEQLQFLGFFHSHPEYKSIKSKQDTEYALKISLDQGNILMGIVGKRMVMRMYLVQDQRIKLIPGVTKFFKIAMKE